MSIRALCLTLVCLGLLGCQAAPSSAPTSAPSAPTNAPAAPTAAPAAPTAAPAAATTGPTAPVPTVATAGASNVAGTITFAVSSEPNTTDPAIEVAGPGYRLNRQAYEGLIAYDGNTTNLVPALALSWQVAPDGSSIDFKLRPNVKFHDGTTLDADTVKQSIDRTKVVNRGGAFFLQNLKEVQVVDPMTVRLVATQPSVSLLYGLPKVYITGKAHLSDPDHGAAFFATNVNGTGPYKLTRWDKGQQMVLDQFQDYWGGWSGNHVAQVVMRTVPETGTQQLLLEHGDANMVVLPSIGITQDPKQLASEPGIKMVESPSLRVTVISMNTQKGPLKDIRLRKALQYAFDYQGMLQIYQGYAEVPNSPLPKGFTSAYDASLPPFHQDLDQARQLLTQAGYTNGGLTLNFMYTETEQQARLCGLLLQSTLQQLGVTLILQATPFATEVSQIANLDTAPDIQATLTMTPRTADPGELLSTLYAGNNVGQSYNYSWYASPDVDQMLAQADRTFDDNQRLQIYRQVAQKLIDDAPSIWAAYPQLVEVMRDNVQNYVYSPLDYTGVFAFYPISLKP
ncbi:MAG: ABC transporter substrate-binding protein [Chloroflexi bacterium]|nr:ABC transporter substrate-binding protein [Chloroflexota bacterium]